MRCSLSQLVLLLGLTGILPASSGIARDMKPQDFVTVQKGTLPIILSAPHGGRKKLADVPERKGLGIANFAVVLDNNTAEVAEKIAAELTRQLNGQPWLVVARFERKFIDVNRSCEEGYESERAKPYYDAYHEPLEAACKTVQEKFGRGILLDIHGQGEFPGEICRGTQNGKTVKLLNDRYGWQAVTGKKSILGLLQDGGYKVLPNCRSDPRTKEEAHFSGGYIVGHYGSHTGYGIDAIQLEIGSYLREREKYSRTATDIADAVAIFYREYLKDE